MSFHCRREADMHGIVRKRKHRQPRPPIKWLTPEQQCAQALKLVPTAHTSGIRDVLGMIQVEKEIARVEIPLLKDWQDAAAVLRAADLVLSRPSLRAYVGDDLLWRLREAREGAEEATSKDAPKGHGGRQLDAAQAAAALYAGVLLWKERGQCPTLTVGGDWHKLAAILYGYGPQTVDQFGFHYLRRAYPKMVEDH
jgi:hypothetical protein